jgi:peptidyl-prolyl cis-trans isomerase SurA
MKNIILTLICILFVNSAAVAQQQAVVAVVNDEPITDLDIQKRADLLIKSSGMNPDAKTIKLMKEHVLYGLIDEKLIAREAKSKSVEIDDADLAFAMNSIAEKNGISIMELDKFLAKTGVNKAVLEDQITSQLLLNKYMRTVLMPKISVSEKEVEESRGTLIKALSKSKNKISQVKLSEIVLYPKYNKKDAEMPLAEKLVSELRAGADFATLAKEFSDSSSAASGGNIGWVYIDQAIPEIANALASLEAGQVTHPIVLNDGIHILKAVEMKFKQDNSVPEKINDEQIKDVLLNKKLDLQVKGLIRKLRRDSYVSFKKS